MERGGEKRWDELESYDIGVLKSIAGDALPI